MGEVDYQTALLLQYKFQQEYKSKENTDSDHQLALELHKQFQAEVEIERPKNNLVYEASSTNTSKCLVDPSWEVIDPTPDVHVLFMSFNERFFWNKLLAVTVAWSKRMTTCAGVCSYQGRGGLCSITLSEPLLKLRPRKDLVETLLHEMIHAYLFVTDNNKDRDGHGPEFHKHMYRINAEAGTNITVYHNFHDEVRLYQQHWWRCDGPCQNWKPYFGMVRRATNRIPGPNDRWWGEHSRNCGGNFIKVKSPEPVVKNNKKGTKAPKEVAPKSDIRKYISSSEKNNVSDKENKSVSPVIKFGDIKSVTKNTTLPNKVNSISNNSNAKITNVIPSKTSNIYGFTGITGGTSKATTPKKSGTSGVKGAVKNAGSNTFVITKGRNNSASTSKMDNNSVLQSSNKVELFGGTGRMLGSLSSGTDGYSTVREHWINKFDHLKTKGVKRSSSSASSTSPKIAKNSNSTMISNKSDPNEMQCPVCYNSVKADLLNDHLDTCLETYQQDKECIICGNNVSRTEYEKHVTNCSELHFNNDNLGRESCENGQNNDTIDLTDSKLDKEQCPVCKTKLTNIDYDRHVEQCLLKMYDELDDKYDLNKNTQTSCLACNKQILKAEINSHLEECVSMSNIFDTSNVSVEENEDENDSEDIRYNCPFCLDLILDSEMQSHLEICLKTEEDEKSVLVESLCSSSYESD